MLEKKDIKKNEMEVDIKTFLRNHPKCYLNEKGKKGIGFALTWIGLKGHICKGCDEDRSICNGKKF